MSQSTPTLEAVDEFYGDVETFIALNRACAPDGCPYTTVGAGVLVRLRQLYAPVRYARRLDENFCSEALERLSDVTRGLSPDQIHDLLDLVSELHATSCGEWRSDEKQVRRWQREGRASIDNIRRKLSRVHTALMDLQRSLHRAGIRLDFLESDLQSAAEMLDPDELPTYDLVTHWIESTPRSDSPMVLLYGFFVEQCRLDDSDAQVRTGKIANLVFGSNVSVIEHPASRSDERRGCEAVRKAVERKRASERKKRVGQATPNPPQS